MSATLALAVPLALAAAFMATRAPVAAAEGPRVFGVYAVWFEGSNDANRALIDDFLACLIDGSNLNSFWQGEAGLERRGSWALPRPDRQLDHDEVASALLAPAIGAPGGLPAPRADETPLYLVFGGYPDLWVNACGRNGEAVIGGRVAGVALVRNNPHCWPAGGILRSETQNALHEIVETVDRVLGHGTCAAGGTCRGRVGCEGRCESFVGLQCAGAPIGTYTGCNGGQVDGWVVQKLGYAGRDPARCDACAVCDFTPRACGPDEPECAQVPPRTASAGGCAAVGGGPASGVAALAALAFVARRRRR